MNEIDKKQVETRMLNLLRARTLIYRRAKNCPGGGPDHLAGVPDRRPDRVSAAFPSKPFIAFAALMFSFLEVLLLRPLAQCAAQERCQAAGGFRLHGVADGLEHLPRRQSHRP
jgi:hypothetical protein